MCFKNLVIGFQQKVIWFRAWEKVLEVHCTFFISYQWTELLNKIEREEEIKIKME